MWTCTNRKLIGLAPKKDPKYLINVLYKNSLLSSYFHDANLFQSYARGGFKGIAKTEVAVPDIFSVVCFISPAKGLKVLNKQPRWALIILDFFS